MKTKGQNQHPGYQWDGSHITTLRLRLIVQLIKDLKLESNPTRQNEIFHACFRALLSEFSDCEPEAEVIPWGDGINRVTVFRLGGIIGDQQELPGSRPRDKSGCRVPQVRNS